MNALAKSRGNKEIMVLSYLLVYFLVLTLFFTRPLLTRIATHSAAGSGDNHYFIWIIGWTKQALFELWQSPHKSFLLNYPYGYQLALTEIAPLQVLVALPLTLIFNNPVLGYNFAMLSTFILSGIFMFYWIRHLTGSIPASLVAGTAYAFLPYHFAHMLSGHLNLVAIQWFPLYFWGLFEIFSSEEFSWKNCGLFAVGLSGIALSSQYYLFMTLFVSLVLLIIILIRKRFKLHWETWKSFFISGLISLPALLVGIIPYYLVHRGGDTTRPITDVMTYSASITDYLLPFTKNPLFGEWVSSRFPRNLWGESTLYLGLPILMLAIFAWLNRRSSTQSKTISYITWIAVVAFVLSLGTNLMWMEQPLVLKTPAWLNIFIKTETFYIYLPGYLLYQYFPFYDMMRAWMRYGMIVMLMVCALAGVGVHALLRKVKTRFRAPISLIILALVIIDFSVTPLSLAQIAPRLVDVYLSDQPYGAQVQLPLAQSYDPRTIYFTLINQKPLLGQMNTYPSHRYFQLEPILSQFPNETSVQRLRDENITYVLVDQSSLQSGSSNTKNLSTLGVEFAGNFDEIALFLIQ